VRVDDFDKNFGLAVAQPSAVPQYAAAAD
jgi:hypothetical protein